MTARRLLIVLFALGVPDLAIAKIEECKPGKPCDREESVTQRKKRENDNAVIEDKAAEQKRKDEENEKVIERNRKLREDREKKENKTAK